VNCMLHRPREIANLFWCRRIYCEGRLPDKGEVGGSSPPRPTIQISKYAAILTFPLPGACSEKAVCQKFAKSSSRLTLPSIRVGECGFRSFWTIRATGTVVNDPGGAPILRGKCAVGV
jgi:hypothetical protein